MREWQLTGNKQIFARASKICQMDYELEKANGYCKKCRQRSPIYRVLSEKAAVGGLRIGKKYCMFCLRRPISPCWYCKKPTDGHLMTRNGNGTPYKWLRLCGQCVVNSEDMKEMGIQTIAEELYERY